LQTVAGRYGFSGAAIARASRRALATARLRDPRHVHVNLDDLSDASRQTFSHRMGGMAQRIPTGFRWDDLVLPAETLEAVQEVVRFAKHRPFLLEQWGFAAKLPYGRGVSAILAGPPGTGKTMVAQLLAHDLGYDLYRIDLSQIVNKYIGETEKNLAKIFEQAEQSHAVLFFDEADSLFAKRTEVKSSNDRYANLEVNYLLQRMETYDGVTLLATNIEQGLDEAFKRRVRFSVQFELPEEGERKRLWISMFPPKVPLDPNINWDLIASRFVMAGGYIKKAALRAALIAVSANRAISTNDLFEAARLEYREMGRIVAG
jgi:SpoVK/Ycf46/Vps4 family AAA+-type ATPase